MPVLANRLQRAAVGLLILACIAILPMAVLAARGPATPGAKPTVTHGPKRTPAPTPTTAPTAAPTIAPTPAPTAVPTVLPTILPTVIPTDVPTAPPTAAPPAILVGAGDIASCASTGDEATASLLASTGGTVFTLGDNVYDNGTPTEFANCYNPSWGVGAIKDRTRPTAGNHDYGTTGAAGYYGYFGTAAGDPANGYYAYDLGTWRVYVLNSNCSIVACAAGSAQEQWLRADLAANPRACTVAMWHHPRFSSGATHGSSSATQALWQALYDANAELILSGHEHNYERFAPQTATGTLDNALGIVEMVVGTGGRSHYLFGTTQPNSLVRNSDAYGVLRLALSAGSWSFSFLHEAGASFTDSGTGTCH